MKPIYTILIFISALLLSGCYTYFEPDIPSTPVVCLNSLITAGEKISVEVTRTWRYSEGNPVSDKIDINLNNAEVTLYVNGQFQEVLTLTPPTEQYKTVTSYYEAKYIPRCGDRLRIHASDKTYGEAEAEVTIPTPVKIDNVKTFVKKNDSSYYEYNNTFTSSFDMILNVYFTDPADRVNYYIFDLPTYKSILYEDEDAILNVSIAESLRLTPDYSFEPIFSEHISPVETIISDAYGLYTVFSDRQFSGKQYCLEIPVSGYYNCDYTNHPDLDDKLTLDVNLNHISTEYYSYMLSLWASTEGISGALGGVGLGDVVFEHSNVSTGAGIIATQATSTFALPIHDLLRE